MATIRSTPSASTRGLMVYLVVLSAVFQPAATNICIRDPTSLEDYYCHTTGTERFYCPETAGTETPEHYHWLLNEEVVRTLPVLGRLVLDLDVQCNVNYTTQCIGPTSDDRKYIIGPECDPGTTTAGLTTTKDTTDDTTDHTDTTDNTNATTDDTNATTDGTTNIDPGVQHSATEDAVVAVAVVVSAFILALVVTAVLVMVCCRYHQLRKREMRDVERSQETANKTEETFVQLNHSTNENSTSPCEGESTTPSVEENPIPSVVTAITPVIKKGRGRAEARQETLTPLPTLQVHRQFSHDGSGTDLHSPTRREPAQFVTAGHNDSGSPLPSRRSGSPPPSKQSGSPPSSERPTTLDLSLHKKNPLEAVEGNEVPIHHSTPKREHSTPTYSVEESSKARKEACVKNQSQLSPVTPIGQNAYIRIPGLS